MNELRIAVTPSGFDDIGAVLDELEFPFTTIDLFELDSAALDEFDVLFINCASEARELLPTHTLRNFVARGGTLYASDWGADQIANAFPKLMTFDAPVGSAGDVHATVVDRGLQQILGERLNLHFDMPGWIPIQSVDATAVTFLTDGSKPLLVSVAHGKGRIIYTCFHNHAQLSESERELIRFLVLKPLVSDEEDELTQADWADASSLQQVVATVATGEHSPWYTYEPSVDGPVSVMLNWRGGARLALEVASAGQPEQRQSGEAPVRVTLPGQSRSPIRYRVVGLDVPLRNQPFVLMAGSGGQLDFANAINASGSLVALSGGSYRQRWGEPQPGCLIVLLDQSKSMGWTFGGAQVGAGRRKADMLATVLNRMLNELIVVNTAGAMVKNRAHVAVLGYAGDQVRSLLPPPLDSQPFALLGALAEHPLRVERRTVKAVDDEGRGYEETVSFPVWVEAAAGGGTPMCAALRRARDLASDWVQQHRTSFPPIVVNITDGGAGDGDPTRPAEELSRLSTNDGGLLLFNCHLTNTSDAPIEFPSSDGVLPADRWANRLFFLSSFIPDTCRDSFSLATGRDLAPGTRAYVFNGDASSLRRVLQFGSTVAQQPGLR